MRSIKLEYLRFDNPKAGVLIADKPYLRIWGFNSVKEVTCPFEHLELMKKLHQLRYNQRLTNQEKRLLIKDLSDSIKNFIAELKGIDKYPVQIDLVLNANELGFLPFELILNEQDEPYFTSPEKGLILTRRIRQDHFFSAKEEWSVVPKVLFAYANPNYGSFNLKEKKELPYNEVPYKEHLNSIKYSLKYWRDEDSENNDILTVLENPSLETLKETIEKANNGNNKDIKPFTHIHLLAHGALIIDDDTLFNPEFGVALRSENKEPTRFAELTEFIGKLKKKPFVISYMICDGANNFNPLRKERNIVQVTHEVGVPIVIGSQLPLTFDGSVQITDDFYKGLFDGNDVRKVLHNVRCNLYKQRENNHDWLSFVSYVRLPEGYEDFLEENTLKRELAALKNINKKTENLLDDNTADVEKFNDLIYEIKDRIQVLESQIKKVTKLKIRQGVFEENCGLLGSAYKRLAELIFHRNTLQNKKVVDSHKEQINVLKQAKDYYKSGSDYNLSHHWSIVQFLSLETVLYGKISEHNYWYAGLQASMNDAKKKEEIWAYGSLVELYLLSPDKDDWGNHLKEAKKAAQTLVKRSKKQKDLFPIESTKKQLLRYTTWWIKENGYTLKLIDSRKGDIESIIELLDS